MNDAVAILCAGGPAPGMNTVVSSVAKVFLRKGFRVIGLHEGYKTLFTDEPNIQEIDFKFADQIYSRGGSALQMSRYKPKDPEFNSGFFTKNNVKLLVTVGGDDTASTANRIAKYLHENKIDVANIHVPKTIDNDLPLPEGSPTFGYHTAKDEGAKIATTIYEDARTSGNWFVISAMGREAGHLAFGIGLACHYPMIVIPEMFGEQMKNCTIRFDQITRLIVSAMIKRKILGINYGAVVVSEGVFHFMSDEEVKNSGINFTYDEHGHPELGNVSKSHIFNVLVQRELKSIGLNIKSRPEELGYELRCCRPIAFDLAYCTALGTGVYKLFNEGATGCMVTVTPNGDIRPLYLKDVAGEDGKVKPRLVNMEAERTKITFENNLHYITEEDYEAAKQYVSDPEKYDFNKIING